MGFVKDSTQLPDRPLFEVIFWFIKQMTSVILSLKVIFEDLFYTRCDLGMIHIQKS